MLQKRTWAIQLTFNLFNTMIILFFVAILFWLALDYKE